MSREAMQIAMDALDEIALAGMSGSGQESEEGLRHWHARRAWDFIRIAAQARSAITALAAEAVVADALSLGEIAIEECLQLGYMVADGRLEPPESSEWRALAASRLQAKGLSRG